MRRDWFDQSVLVLKRDPVRIGARRTNPTRSRVPSGLHHHQQKPLRLRGPVWAYTAPKPADVLFRRFRGRHNVVPLSSLQRRRRFRCTHYVSNYMAAEPRLQTPQNNQGQHIQDTWVRVIVGWSSNELVLAKRHREVRRFGPTPGTIHPTIQSTHSPTGPHESVLLDCPRGDQDSAPILHPVLESEESVETFAHYHDMARLEPMTLCYKVELLTIRLYVVIQMILCLFNFYYRKLMYIPDFSGTF